MTRRMFARAVRYSHHMPDWVREHSLAGLTSNDDIADILRNRFDARITAKDVSHWRREHAKFESAVSGALNEFQAECISQIKEAVRGGDVATAKWFMERTSERFKPSSKIDLRSTVSTLDERLRKRAIDEQELLDAGVLYHEKQPARAAFDHDPNRPGDDSDDFYE